MSNQYKFDETTGKWLESGAILSGVNSVNGLAGDITLLPVGIVTTTTGDVSPPVYAKVYTGDTAPATPVTGDIWIDSTYGSGTSNILRWRKLAGGGETSLSGTDATGQPLVYTPGYEELYINGVLQYRGSDYVATTGNTITAITALVASDTVEVVAPSALQVGDYYTQAQSDAKYFNSSVPSSNRNVIINGNFAIDQRNAGAAQTLVAGAANVYTVDRWYANCAGANVTAQRISGSAPDQYYYRFTGASSNTQVSIAQRIEAANSYHLAGQTVTLSVKLASTSLTSVTWGLGYATATDNFAGITSGPSGTFTINSTLTTYSATFTIPAGATTGLRLLFQTTGLAAAQTLTFSAVQLEAGVTATPFERRPISTELALCQRYYEKSYNSEVVPGTVTEVGAFYAWGSTQADGFIGYAVCFKVPKRNSTYAFTAYSPASGASGNWDVLRAGSVSTIGISGYLGKGETVINPYVQSGANNALARVYGQWSADAEL